MAKKWGVLVADRLGFFRLYAADLDGCWHYDGPCCDQRCVRPGAPVPGFVPTNAYGPAEVQAARLGYDLLER